MRSHAGAWERVTSKPDHSGSRRVVPMEELFSGYMGLRTIVEGTLPVVDWAQNGVYSAYISLVV